MIDWEKLKTENVHKPSRCNAYDVQRMMPHLVRHLKAQADACDPATQEVVSTIGELLLLLAGASEDAARSASHASAYAAEMIRCR